MRPPSPATPLNLPPEWYVPRGRIRLSPEALAVARQLVDRLWKDEARGPCIATFHWMASRTTFVFGTRREFEEGPGLALFGNLNREIRTHTVERFDGTPVVFLIPPDVVEAAPARLVVCEPAPSGRPRFRLI